jgi:hypothetical protein
MDPDYKELRKQEYFSGTRSWNIRLTNGDYNRFTEEYLVPLRQLNSNGIFGSFDAPTYAVSGDEVQTHTVDVT